jgi:hypothetical protein
MTCRNEQCDIVRQGCTISIRNGKTDVFQGSLRLDVDKWGSVSLVDAASSFSASDLPGAANLSNNVSQRVYELVAMEGGKTNHRRRVK